MSTNIEYLDETWNVASGCDVVSEGCRNCWARTVAEGRLRGRFGYDNVDPFAPKFWPDRLDAPLHSPAAVRFVSVEPMLGPVDLWGPHYRVNGGMQGAVSTWPGSLDWVILGGETGPGARPMRPEWALDVYRQCKVAGVPFFWKAGSRGLTYDPEMTATREVSNAV